MPQCDEHAYRAYVIGSDNRIIGLPLHVRASDDHQAIKAVQELLGEELAETERVDLWDFGRRLISLRRAEERLGLEMLA